MERHRHSWRSFGRPRARTQAPWRWWGLLTVAGLASASADLQGAVQIGKHSIASAEVTRALDECQANSAAENQLTCLTRAWVPLWLLDAHIADHPELRSALQSYEENDLMHRALVEKIQTTVAPASTAEIDAYLEKNKRDFQKPLRIRLFRILVASSSEAQEVLAELGSPVSIDSFRKIARAHSLDTATHERGGDLGFVWPDGSTDIPQVSAEPALYQAALELKDGQLAEKPIPEGERFAILWRRGSLPAEQLSAESRQIAKIRIQEARAEKEIETLLLKEGKLVTEKSALLLGFLRRPGTKLFETR